MKKINILFASVIVSMAASCTAEKALGPVHSSFVKYDFEATAGDVITKTSLGADQKTVSWTAGDQISVFSLDADTPANNLFALKEGETAKFSGEIEEDTQNIVAVYPYAASNQLDRSTEAVVVKAVIPAAQTATKDSFSNGSALMFYSGPLDASLAFKNISAVVSFVLPEELGMVNSVKVSAANSSAIAGNVSVNMQGNVSNADATVIELAGDFEGANTYYFAMLPGQYTGGLLFEVATEGGNKFYRQNASSMVLDAGTVNKVGTLSLVMDTEMLTPAVTLAHTFDADILTGTKVEASVAVPAEFAGLLSEVAWSAELVNASSEVVRTVEGTGLDAAEMSVQNGFVYLPAGEYTLRLTNFAYKACGQKRQVAGVDSKTAPVTAAAPAANTLKFTTTTNGYTSYSVYKGIDGKEASVEAANALDGSSVYGATADYLTIGLSSEIQEQCSSLKFSSLMSIKASIDDHIANEDNVISGAPWEHRTIDATVTFDGVNHLAPGTKEVDITGLPYNPNNEGVSSHKGTWSFPNNNVRWEKTYIYNTLSTATLTFNVPSDILTTSDYNIRIYSGAGIKGTVNIQVGNTTICTESHSAFAKSKDFSGSNKESIITKTSNTVLFKHSSTSSAATSLSAYSYLYYVSVIYRAE